MDSKVNEDKLIEIFIWADDFVKASDRIILASPNGQIRGRLAQATGTYFVDSKKLPVCDNRRIHSHKVFKDIAQRGKTSTGWFWGMKIYLIINNLGEVVNFVMTAGNVCDNAKKVLDKLFDLVHGKCFGDKGYMTKLFEHYLQQGLQLITRIRKNMKNQLVGWCDKMMLFKRGIIESVNDILMTVFDIDHTRHRSPINAAHTYSAQSLLTVFTTPNQLFATLLFSICPDT